MKNLKVNKKVVYAIDYDDWDNFVNDYFGFKYSLKHKNPYYEIAADEETANDTKFEYKPNGEIDDYDKSDNLKPILDGIRVPNYSTRTIMDYFVQKGILDKGKIYQIEISW